MDGIGAVSSHRVDRISSRHTFAELRRAGVRGRSGPVSVVFLSQTSWSRPQIAYAIGRRAGNAVVRNRIKRRLRSLAREVAAGLPPGAYLVSTGPGAARISFDELRKAMTRALRAAVADRAVGSDSTRNGDPR